MEEIDHLLKELYKFNPEVLTLEKPLKNIQVIESFEKKHNFKLPDDFKYLLSKHDGLDLMGVSIYGFTGTENLETVYDFEHNEVAYPQYEYLIPFSPDGGGNFYCFDTRKHTGNNKSCPVIFWTSNYEYNEVDQPEITHSNLSEWINEVMIEWTLESYNYDGSDKE